jgi:SAGA-associated factor 73
MGAKRAVQGRSRNYDELLHEWNRAHNPNYVERVKKETKAEKKEKKEREKAEKKRLALEAAAAAGIDPTKKGSTSGASGNKKGGKKAAAAVRLADALGDDIPENLDDLDSEAEVDDLVAAVRLARERGVVAVPLAVPCDAGSWFVGRREKKRCCQQLLMSAITSGNGSGTAVATGAPTNLRTSSISVMRL